MKRTYYFEIIILILLICFNLIVDFQDFERIKQITKEDGIIETSEAVLYFAGACLLFYLFIQSKSENKIYFLGRKRNLFFLLCGLLFIFFAGEEISWGQRIFNIGSPEYFQKNNYQHETNFHNLPLFGVLNQRQNKGIGILFTSNVMLYMFYFFFCFFIPLLNKFSKKIRNMLEKISLPVIPLWIGCLFPISFIINETIERLGWIDYFQIGEMSENNFAVLAFIAIISLLNEAKKSGKYLKSEA